MDAEGTYLQDTKHDSPQYSKWTWKRWANTTNNIEIEKKETHQ